MSKEKTTEKTVEEDFDVKRIKADLKASKELDIKSEKPLQTKSIHMSTGPSASVQTEKDKTEKSESKKSA